MPSDEDRAALAQLADTGVDLTRPRKIEFTMFLGDEAQVERTMNLLSAMGFEPSRFYDKKTGTLSVYAGKVIVPTYDNVVAEQLTINRALSELGVECDGWVTRGDA